MCGETIMADIAACRTRNEVARIYADALDCLGASDRIFTWTALNTAVRQEAERLERVNKSPVADILDTEEAQL